MPGPLRVRPPLPEMLPARVRLVPAPVLTVTLVASSRGAEMVLLVPPETLIVALAPPSVMAPPLPLAIE